MRGKLIVGNWKMQGGLTANAELLSALKEGLATAGKAHLAVCVPYPYLAQAQAFLQGSAIGWGAQDLSEHAAGAYTGEVSAAMLRDFACRYVIVGHSERRTLHAESDEEVAAKAEVAIAAGLTPIVCVGETLAERDGGRTMAVVERQLKAVADRLAVKGLAHCVLAYEPVWAIGTGRTATPDQAQEVHAALRALLAARERSLAESMQILYGGSMKAANAAELLAMRDVDGGLIGGASLVPGDFLAIYAAACEE